MQHRRATGSPSLTDNLQIIDKQLRGRYIKTVANLDHSVLLQQQEEPHYTKQSRTTINKLNVTSILTPGKNAAIAYIRPLLIQYKPVHCQLSPTQHRTHKDRTHRQGSGKHFPNYTFLAFKAHLAHTSHFTNILTLINTNTEICFKSLHLNQLFKPNINSAKDNSGGK